MLALGELDVNTVVRARNNLEDEGRVGLDGLDGELPNEGGDDDLFLVLFLCAYQKNDY